MQACVLQQTLVMASPAVASPGHLLCVRAAIGGNTATMTASSAGVDDPSIHDPEAASAQRAC